MEPVPPVAASLPAAVELIEQLWCVVYNYLDLESLAHVAAVNRQQAQLVRGAWKQRTKLWIARYGPCGKEKGRATSWARFFRDDVFRSVLLPFGVLPPPTPLAPGPVLAGVAVSMFNIDYRCVVQHVQLTPTDLRVHIFVMGSLALGALQSPLSSRLHMEWGELLPPLLQGQEHPHEEEEDEDEAEPQQFRVRRRSVVPASVELVPTAAPHTLSACLIFARDSLTRDSFMSFEYGSAGYSAAPLFFLPSHRVPAEWRWRVADQPSGQPAGSMSLYWPSRTWLPRAAGAYAILC
jgi:hypothetical protein